MDEVQEDMKLAGVREEEEDVESRRRQIIGCGHHWREQPTKSSTVMALVHCETLYMFLCWATDEHLAQNIINNM